MDLSDYRQSVSILQFVQAEREKMAAREKELQEIERDALGQIQEAMSKDKAEDGEIDGKPVVTWHRGTQNRLNQKLLRERFPEIYEVCKTPLETRTWRVIV